MNTSIKSYVYIYKEISISPNNSQDPDHFTEQVFRKDTKNIFE